MRETRTVLWRRSVTAGSYVRSYVRPFVRLFAWFISKTILRIRMKTGMAGIHANLFGKFDFVLITALGQLYVMA